MNSVFIDTSFYIAFASPRDRWHQEATAIGSKCRGTMITTEFILVELGNYLCAVSKRRSASQIISMLRSDKRTVIIPASSQMVEAGTSLFNKRGDKSWSLTDCISFALMEKEEIRQAYSFDHHFSQAGFEVFP